MRRSCKLVYTEEEVTRGLITRKTVTEHPLKQGSLYTVHFDYTRKEWLVHETPTKDLQKAGDRHG